MELTHIDDVVLEDGGRVRIELDTSPHQLVLRAIDDAGRDAGTATCDLRPTARPNPITIDVIDDARGRGIGTALFTRLLDAAADRAIEWLTFTGPADDALLRLAATSGSICARRVTGDRAKAVILVPDRRAA